MKEVKLQRVIFLDENTLNPNCHWCGKELSSFLITQQELTAKFTPTEIRFMFVNKLIKPSITYSPKYILFLCRICLGKENKK